MAWLAGSVHGVVVQITAKASPPISLKPKLFQIAADFTHLFLFDRSNLLQAFPGFSKINVEPVVEFGYITRSAVFWKTKLLVGAFELNRKTEKRAPLKPFYRKCGGRIAAVGQFEVIDPNEIAAVKVPITDAELGPVTKAAALLSRRNLAKIFCSVRRRKLDEARWPKQPESVDADDREQSENGEENYRQCPTGKPNLCFALGRSERMSNCSILHRNAFVAGF